MGRQPHTQTWKHKKLKQNSMAFTLIELMVAMAILGLLISLALPKLNEYKANSNDATSLADARNASVLLSSSLRR